MECPVQNIAFIDGQNLHLGTKNFGWAVDHKRLRVYLKDKYQIEEAHYFIGFMSQNESLLYRKLEEAGFTLHFKEHLPTLTAQKKGNIDSDLVFEIMKKLVEGDVFDRVFIISGDGDYKKLVDFLIKKNRFGKILFPNQQFSSFLYKSLGWEFFDYLDSPDTKEKIGYFPISNQK